MYEEIVRQYLVVGHYTGAEYMCRCPYHENNSFTLQFNIDTGLWLCFSCGATGNAKTLMHDMGGHFIDEGPSLTDLKTKLDLLRHQSLVTQKPKYLHEAALKRYRFPTNYWTDERDLSKETVAAFDLGYDPIENYVTIPVRDLNGHLLGIIKRYLDDDAITRYLYPRGFKKAHNLFASWLVAEDDRDHVVLTEGSIDAMKVWQAGFSAMAILGSSISHEQFDLLRKLGVRHVTTFFDNDTAGKRATRSAYGYKTHIRHGQLVLDYNASLDLRTEFTVDSVKYKRGMKKDPAACTELQIKLALANTYVPDID